jgi:hypothetical protein
MVRSLVCAALALVVAAGVGFTAEKKEKKKTTNVAGKVKKFDSATGTLMVAIKSKKETTEKEFKLGDGVKFNVFAGEPKPKQLTGKEGYADLKEGAPVVVSSDADGKVLSVRVGNPPPKPKTEKKTETKTEKPKTEKPKTETKTEKPKTETKTEKK